MASIDEVCPGYVGDERFTLQLTRPLEAPTAFRVVDIEVDYSAALPDGVAVPVEFSVSGPTLENNDSRIYRRRPPRSVSFVPREGGTYLVRVRELTHNRWYGQLVVEVSGENERRPRRDEGDG